MTSYVDPTRVTYTRTVSYNAAATYSISPPPGCDKFRVDDIQASVTTAFVGTTSPARVGVGVAGNVDDAGYIDFGTAATPAAINTTVGYKDQRKALVNPVYPTIDLNGADNTLEEAAGQTPLASGPALITFTPPVGGSIAGVAVVDVTIAWF